MLLGVQALSPVGASDADYLIAKWTSLLVAVAGFWSSSTADV
jgi:hypothetical protein